MTQIEEWLDEDDSAGYVRLPSMLFQLLSQTDPERYSGLIASFCSELVDCDRVEVEVAPVDRVRAFLLGEREPSDRPSRSSRWQEPLLEVPVVAYRIQLGTVSLERAGGFSDRERGLLRRFLELAALGLYGALARVELRRIAHEDSLTGLANRRGLEAHLQRKVAATHTLLFVDLDGLKRLNDELGYEAGDALLIAVGNALRDWLPTGGLAARLGGDEFVVSLPREHVAHADAAAAELQKRLQSLELPQTLRERFEGVSVGVVSARPGEAPAEQLARAGRVLRRHKGERRRARNGGATS